MSNEFLSQEEVDALLRGVSGETEEAKVEEDEGGIRTYNLATQERIVRGRMPTLETINERFARNLRIGLFNFMRRTPEISVGPARTLKYGEFVRNLVVPTNLNVVHMRPLRGSALIVFEPRLVFLVIDNLFGGDGRFHTRVEGRDFTQTEQRIIQRMLQVVFEDYERAWAAVHPLKFEYVRSEMHTQFTNIATSSEIVVVATSTSSWAATRASSTSASRIRPSSRSGTCCARACWATRQGPTGAGCGCCRARCRSRKSRWSPRSARRASTSGSWST